MLLEQPGKMLRIFEPEVVSNLAERFAVVMYSFFRHFNHFRLDVFLGGFPGFLFDQVAKIAG